MQNKISQKIIVDKTKLDTLIRLGCPIEKIIKVILYDCFESTNDSLIDSFLESLCDRKVFSNWGGIRKNSGRISGKKNQLDYQLENQDANQLGRQVVDKDKDIDKDIIFIKDNKFSIENIPAWLLDSSGYDDLTSEQRGYFDHPALRTLLNKYWQGDSKILPEIEKTYLEIKSGKNRPKKEKFAAPNLDEVIQYARERDCKDETAKKFFDYYTAQSWKDSKGNPVKNWKGKFIAVWEKPENKVDPNLPRPNETKSEYLKRQSDIQAKETGFKREVVKGGNWNYGVNND